MSDKLKKLREQHELEEYEMQVGEVKDNRKSRALFALGGIKAADQIASSIFSAISSQSMKALDFFQKEKMYLDLGYETFVDFLQNSEFSPMTKSQYYERKNLISNEGEVVYDYLNSIGLSVSVRKLLTENNGKEISIEGDYFVVGEEKIEMKESSSIKNLLLEIANDNRKLKEENKKQAEKLEKGKGDFDRLKQRLSEAENSTATADYSKNPVEKMNAIALGGLSGLADELKKASLVDCQYFTDSNLRLLVSQFQRVQEVLCKKLAVESADELLVSNEDEDRITSLLDDED
jgi:hypothetical protein